ncbi:hypothetical protein SSS_06153 [Sarcoptes scabiei]|uniref:Uncharacterized protein n=1 Tax=Sarcoptes scabiei TaxID=52283 RepID=A0A834VE92_SARSC|nr:hypothetical protein SSS_06153 [Sarcoptes scabiei]
MTIGLLMIAWINFPPFNRNKLVLLSNVMIDWVINPNIIDRNEYRKNHLLLNECDQSTLDSIKLIVTYSVLLHSIYRIVLNLIATIIVVNMIYFHLINHDTILLIVIDVLPFLISVQNARLFIDFANSYTVYVVLMKTYFCGNYDGINERFRNEIIHSSVRIRIKSIRKFLKHHNDLCRLLREVEWSIGNFITIIFNLPVNIVLINIIINYELSMMKKAIFYILIVTHSLMMFSHMESLHPIHTNAHSSRKIIQSLFARRLIRKPTLIRSLRFKIKLVNQLERLTSKNFQLGINLGTGKPITHWKLWKLFLLYGIYFLNAYSFFKSKTIVSIDKMIVSDRI